MNHPREAQLAAARTAMERSNTQLAIELAAQLIKENPQYQDGQVLFSQITLEIGRNTLALDSARRAIVLDKTNGKAMLQLSRAYHAGGFLTQALQAAQQAENLIGENGDMLSSLGTIYFRMGEFDDAARMHQRATEVDPGNAGYLYNLATSVQSAGNLKRAETLFNQVLERNPDDYNTYMNLARIRTQTSDSNHIPQLQSLLERSSGNREGQMRLLYSLAKEYEDLGDCENSFSHLQRGSDIRRRTINYDIAQELAFVDAMIEHFPSGAFNNYPGGFSSEEPIFIVGMPRSGTTLTEQIISAHSDVFAAGELRDFGMNVALQASVKGTSEHLDPSVIPRLLKTNSLQLGKRYIDKTRPRTGHTRHFIDKLPRNSHLCGFIHWALPKAKIILLDRHPVDVCYSNYKLLFKNGYSYSYDQRELADYYAAYYKLMAHWEKVIPSQNFYRISYENLVENQEEESRKLIDFCGLPWQDSCLEFYNNDQGVATASSAQVRQPIYKSSVARWRHYEKQLQPLINRLQDHGINCS